MRDIIYSIALLCLLMIVGCEKTIHEVNSPLPAPSAGSSLSRAS